MKLRIKEICREKGITISDLASKIDIHQESLSRIISKNSTSTQNLEKIASALDVDIVDLFERQNSDLDAIIVKDGKHYIARNIPELERIIEELKEK